MNELEKITEDDLTKKKTEVEDFKMTTSIDTIVGFVVMSFLTYYYYQLIDYPLFNKHETLLFWSLIAGWIIGVIIPIICFTISYFYEKELKKDETNK